MNSLCEGALSVLEQVYAEDSGLFPFTSRVDGRGYRSVYDHPRVLLSTINCLLGLEEAARHSPDHPFLRRAGEMTRTFVRLHGHEVVAPDDLGLLTLLLAESDDAAVHSDELDRAVRSVGALADGESRLRRLNAQEITWLLWGAVSAGRHGRGDAERAAHRLFAALTTHFLRPAAVLPRHTLSPGRGGLVSFGASVYFLRAAYEYGKEYDSRLAMELFDRGVAALLNAQGPQGEWPWLVSCENGRPLDFYPVFSVHQLSMAMLFLFPAQHEEKAGVPDAIDRSMEWITGKNQLDRPMVQHDPFFIYRSMERRARLARVERFLRARRMLLSKRPGALAAEEDLVLNTESRSYELGWLLYAWSHADGIAGVD